jgi:hypothetical protein
MKTRKLESSEVVGFIISPANELLTDEANDTLVFTERAQRYLLTAKKRDTNLLAMG